MSATHRRVTIYCMGEQSFVTDIPAEDEPMWLDHIQDALSTQGVIKIWGAGRYPQWGTTVTLVHAEAVIGITIHNFP